MSFVGNKQNRGELKLVDKFDENLKNKIKDKLNELQTKNTMLNEKFSIIQRKNYLVQEEDDFFSENLSSSKKDFENLKHVINKYINIFFIRDFENLINKKYSNDLEQKDKLVLMKQMMLKQLEKEAITLEGIKNKFINFKNSQSKAVDYNANDSQNLLHDDLEGGDYKVCSTQIKNLNDVADYRNKKFKSIYEQTKIVETMTKDLNMITQSHTQKLETIDDNIDNLKHNVQVTYRTVLKTSEEDKKFKENKCCIMLLIAFALFFMLLIFLNYNTK